LTNRKPQDAVNQVCQDLGIVREQFFKDIIIWVQLFSSPRYGGEMRRIRYGGARNLERIRYDGARNLEEYATAGR